jgi:hypothetical protein
MGGVSPETCWALYKYGIINFDTLLHLVGFFCLNCITMHGSTNIKFGKIKSRGLWSRGISHLMTQSTGNYGDLQPVTGGRLKKWYIDKSWLMAIAGGSKFPWAREGILPKIMLKLGKGHKKRFVIPVLRRERLQNVGLKGRPHVSGRPC